MGAGRFEAMGGRDFIASAGLCTECGACLAKCPYQLPIPELVREAVAYYKSIPEL
jgi:predicted aldo/keto reductase-like oxidoreductase